ncbi:MAG: hypothetical protein AAF519_17475 [Bacteroidota bacterium]
MNRIFKGYGFTSLPRNILIALTTGRTMASSKRDPIGTKPNAKAKEIEKPTSCTLGTPPELPLRAGAKSSTIKAKNKIIW